MGCGQKKKRRIKQRVLVSRWEAQVHAFPWMGMLRVGVREWWVMQDAGREVGLDIEDLKAGQRLEGVRS